MASNPPINRSTKMLEFINYRMRVTVADDRAIVGTLLAFDGFMNLVLADSQEFRKLRKKRTSQQAQDPTTHLEQEEMRTLGLVLLRGESVVSVQVEAPPKKKKQPVTSSTTTSSSGVAAAAPPTSVVVGGGIPVGRGAPIELVNTSSSTVGYPPPQQQPIPGGGRGRGMVPMHGNMQQQQQQQQGYGVQYPPPAAGGYDGGGRGRGFR
jgi:small nuclear ribonucleoprotein B and B'